MLVKKDTLHLSPMNLRMPTGPCVSGGKAVSLLPIMPAYIPLPPLVPPEQVEKKRKGVENPLPPLFIPQEAWIQASKYAKHHHVSGPARKRVFAAR